jgi:hypothetical protein
VEYGLFAVLQILGFPVPPISVTVCDFELLWHTVREIRMEIITAPPPTLYVTYNYAAFPPNTCHKPKKVFETTRENPYNLLGCY